MKLRMFSKQRGAHHEAVLIIGAVVALVGTLGFVGYNTWQGQSANADVCASKPTKPARLGCLQEKVANINGRIASLQNEINTHPRQSRQNAQRQNQINALVAEKTNNNYEGRIANLQQEIAAANVAKPAAQANKKAPQKGTAKSSAPQKNSQQQAAAATSLGRDACQRVLGRVWSGGKCLTQCRPGAGTYSTKSEFGHCKLAAAGISAAICNAKHRKFENGVCERKWKGNLKPCAAGWGHYKKAKPYSYCRKVNKKTPPISVKTGKPVEPGNPDGDDMSGLYEPESPEETYEELPNEADPNSESEE